MKPTTLFYLFLFTLLFSASASAAEVSYAGLKLEVPDSVIVDTEESGLRMRTKDWTMFITTYGDPEISDKVEFDLKKTFKSFDQLVFNLKNDTITSVEDMTEGVYYPDRYIRRHYASKSQSPVHFTTHTFYTPKRPYIAAIEYIGEQPPAAFDDILASIDDGSNFFSRQWSAVAEGWFLILVFGVCSMIAAHLIGYMFDRERSYTWIAAFVTVAALVIFFIIYPDCILLGIMTGVACYLLGCAGAYSNFEEVAKNVMENI